MEIKGGYWESTGEGFFCNFIPYMTIFFDIGEGTGKLLEFLVYFYVV
jgi:hypothetical protein